MTTEQLIKKQNKLIAKLNEKLTKKEQEMLVEVLNLDYEIEKRCNI